MQLPSDAVFVQGGGHAPPPGGGYPGGPPAGGYGYPPGQGGPGGDPPGGYPAPHYAQPAGAPQAPHGPGADIKKQATTWLIVAAVSFFFCGGINCLGVIGAILSFLAMQAADQGNLSDAEAKLKWGKIVIVTGAVLSFLTWASAVLYYVVASAEVLSNS
ncbi:MAG: hypothetical protein ACOY0T_40875 [Myxococcota bacterium]